jgi:hypothetical protein
VDAVRTESNEHAPTRTRRTQPIDNTIATVSQSFNNNEQLLNISLRMLHVKKQPFLLRPFVKALQTLLRETPLGAAFFGQVATRQGVRNVLEQAYHNKEQVRDLKFLRGLGHYKKACYVEQSID